MKTIGLPIYFTKLLLLTLIIISLLAGVVQADNLYQYYGSWTWQEADEVSNDPNYTRIYYDNIDKKYIILGDNGLLKTSKDLVSWTKLDTGTKERLMGYCHFDKGYTVVGLSGTILVSSDGIVWRNVEVKNSNMEINDFIDVVSNGKVMAATSITSAGGARFTGVSTSTDGQTWERVITLPGIANKMKYSEGVFLLKSGSYSFKSKDGITWEKSGEVNADNTIIGISSGIINVNDKVWTYNDSEKDMVFERLEYINGTYYGICIGSFIYSKDRVKWEIGPTFGLSDFAWDGEKVVAIGLFNTIVSSRDGEAWISHNKEALMLANADLDYVNGRFMFVSGDRLYRSLNGETWEMNELSFEGEESPRNSIINRLISIPEIASNIIWDGHYYWAVRHNMLYQSANAWDWKRVSRNSNISQGSITKIRYIKEDIIGVGTHGIIARFDKTKAEWQLVHGADNKAASGKDTGMSMDKWQLIQGLVGEDISIDDLAADDTGSSDFIDMLYVNNRYYAVSDSGSIYISGDLNKWDTVELGSGIGQVMWNGSQFIATGSGSTLVSDDGYTWKTVGYFDGNIVLTPDGYFGFASALRGKGFVSYSKDGSRWYTIENSIFSGVNDVEFNGEIIVALTDDGRVIYKRLYSGGKLLPELKMGQ